MLPATLTVSAASSSGGELDYGLLGQYGVLGVFAVILWGLVKTFIKREQDRADRLEVQLGEAHANDRDKVIPALVEATTALKETAEVLREIQRDRELDKRRARDR